MMKFGFVNDSNMALLTDLYELTMAQSYFDAGMNETAVFDFFSRRARHRSYLVSAGLEQVLYYLKKIRFTDEEIEFLASSGRFSDDFLHYLERFRFSGDVYAVDEGEILFENEPFITVEAPLIEAQLVETFIINTMQISILTATKAMRCRSVAGETTLVDFGLRRAHGTDAGMKAARSSYIGGFAGTSNVLASKTFGIPAFGTMAHSYVLAHDSELDAFTHFLKTYPDNSILLVDTFDTLNGVKNAIEAARKCGLKNFKGVRLDSGDIEELAKRSRKMLDDAGFKDAMIFVSGGLNEFKIKNLLQKGAPVDGWGVGTELVVSADTPYLDCAYKLVEYNGIPRMKFSPHKVTLPSKKQIYRKFRDGLLEEDTLALRDETVGGTPLMRQYMRNGEILIEPAPLELIRQKAQKSFDSLPPEMREIKSNRTLTPKLSPGLTSLVKRVEKSL
ncbi:nicotinate phosphoribosyltransferase [Hydrogenimonas sp.]|nr:nicotinate phosphoribosyltransferase [Hydrogenimonas sp.]